MACLSLCRQLFEPFAPFFRVALLCHPLVILPAIVIRLRRRPLFAAALVLVTTTIFKASPSTGTSLFVLFSSAFALPGTPLSSLPLFSRPGQPYPAAGDVALYTALLSLFAEELRGMRMGGLLLTAFAYVQVGECRPRVAV